jgi:hypothetical protein
MQTYVQINFNESNLLLKTKLISGMFHKTKHYFVAAQQGRPSSSQENKLIPQFLDS